MNYREFVFDEDKRKFVGRFEEMYRAEGDQGFDSWHQEDSRHLSKRICLSILSDYCFESVLDIGCGKGAFTHQLKKRNNRVLGVDVSATALAVARARYPDVEFLEHDLARDAEALGSRIGGFDLVVCMETLSYLENWKSVLAEFARIGRFCLVALYLPENPIGFVRSSAELVVEFGRLFRTLEHVQLFSHGQVLLFGTSGDGGEAAENARV